MKFRNLFKRTPKAYHHVLDIGDSNFERQVLQRSFKTPMMADFWAAWCGPCRQLLPVLERIVFEPDSPFLLARIDTERHKRVTAQFGVQSLPTVLFFWNGTLMWGFQGLRLEHTVREMVAKTLASPAPQPQLGFQADPSARLAQARTFLGRGDGFRAALALKSLREADAVGEAASALLPAAEFLWDVADGDSFTGNRQLDEQYRETLTALHAQDVPAGLTHLETALTLGSSQDQAYTQKALNSLALLA